MPPKPLGVFDGPVWPPGMDIIECIGCGSGERLAGLLPSLRNGLFVFVVEAGLVIGVIILRC
jgi:hypothetical protein